MADSLSPVFSALSDPTRRAILERLRGGEASAGAPAAPFALSQPAVSRHLKVMERAGLIAHRRAGPDGWSMTRCEIDTRLGGGFRYDWTDASGIGFHDTGILEAVERPGRILHREVTHVPEPTPETLVETRFEPERGGTRLTKTMDLPDAETLEAMLSTGMTDGMEASHARLEAAF